MKTTEKRITLALTTRQNHELSQLSKKMGESPSSVIHRAIAILYYLEFLREDKKTTTGN